MELINGNNYGPMTRYSDTHIFLVMDALERNKRMSRKGLVDETGLGEGSIRGMLKVLKDWKWIEVKQTGVCITEFGRKSFHGFGMRYVDIFNDKYAVGKYQQGIMVEGVADKVTNGMAQRDIAIRNGAEGAVIFVMRDGRIIFPKDWDIDEKDPRFAKKIRDTGMKEGDALVIVDSNDADVARAVAAAVGLVMR